MPYVSFDKLSEQTEKLRRGRHRQTVPLKIYGYHIKGRDLSSLSFSVAPKLRKQLGWLQGDRVDVLWDAETRTGLMRRVATGGWSYQVTKVPPPGESRGTLRVTNRPEYNFVLGPVLSAEVTAEGLEFRLGDKA